MELIDPDRIDEEPAGGAGTTRRRLGEPLDTSDMAINYYELEPGAVFSGGLHAHLDQEELFYVLSGTATFETKPDPTADGETVTVSEGQVVRFAPGEYQQGRNESDEPVQALALGAPKNSTEVRVPVPCRACGGSNAMDYIQTDEGAVLECPACGTQVDA